MAGAVDNMEKYKYMLGQAHAYINILQEISILLNPKEQENDTKEKTTSSNSEKRLNQHY